MRQKSFLAILLMSASTVFGQPLQGPFLVQHIDNGSYADVKIVALNDSTAQIFYTVVDSDHSAAAYTCTYSLTQQSLIGTPQVLFSETGWSASIEDVTVNGAGRWNCVVIAYEPNCDTCRVRTFMGTGFDDVRQWQQIYDGALWGQPFLNSSRLFSRPGGGVILLATEINQQPGQPILWRPYLMYFPNGYATPESQYEFTGTDTLDGFDIKGGVVTADDRLLFTISTDTSQYAVTLPPLPGHSPEFRSVQCGFNSRLHSGRLLNIGFNEMRGGLPYVQINELMPAGNCSELAYYEPGCCYLYPAFHPDYGWAVASPEGFSLGLVRLDTSGAMAQPPRDMFPLESGYNDYATDVALSSGGTVMIAWTEYFGMSTNQIHDLKIATIGWNTPLSVTDDHAPQPERFDLTAYPNPFNATATIRFELPAAGKATLKVFDLLGREVATLASGEFAAGEHTAAWDGSSYSSGLYFIRLESAQSVQVRKIALVK